MFNLAPVPVPDLSGKTILATGTGTGIGAATVRAVLDAGATVFAGHYGPIAEPAALHGAQLLPLDVTRQDDVDAAIKTVEDTAGRLDGLINNAGTIMPIGHLADLKSDDLRPAVEVNLLGTHRMIVAALPLLEASQGVVVNAGTGAATMPMEGWTAYCTSKAAARMLTELCALELSPRGIAFFFLGIPPTDTPMQGAIRTAGLNPISQIPKEDLVDPMVPASVLAWLLGPEARSLTSALLDVRDDFFRNLMNLDGA